MGKQRAGEEAVGVVAQVLKSLYPQNPDVVLGREARNIVDAFRSLPVEQRMEAMGMKPTGRSHCTYHDWFCHNPLDCDMRPTFYGEAKR